MSKSLHLVHQAHQLLEKSKQEGGVVGAVGGAVAVTGATFAALTFFTAPISLPILGAAAVAGAIYGAIKEEHPKK